MKYKYWFDRAQLEQNLKEKSVKGGARTVAAQSISFLLNVASTILLARLLLPQDYGLIAMVTSFTGFVLIFKDLGLSQAVIQRDKLTQEEVSMVFWLNLGVSACLSVLISLLGPLLVWFYDEPKLLLISLAYASIALIGGLSVQHSALLNRQMQFKKLSQITILASAISLAVGLLLAYTDFGYWALVSINVVNVTVQTILLWLHCDWRPIWVKIDSRVKSYLDFGAGVSGFNMINYFSRNLDNVLIGRMIGSNALGLYAKAYQLLMLPITQLRDPLNAVGIPALSALIHDKWKYKHYYSQFLFLLAFFSFPLVAYLYLEAHNIILLLLGENWVEASYIFKLLAFTALIQPVASTRGMVMITNGLTKRYFLWGLYNAIAVSIAFIVGIIWNGIEGLAIAYAAVNYLILIPSLRFCFSHTQVDVFDFFKACYQPFVCTLVAGVALFLIRGYFDDFHLIIRVILTGILFFSIYTIVWLPIPLFRGGLFGVIKTVRLIFNK